MIVNETQAKIDMLIEKGEYDAALVQLDRTNGGSLRSIRLKARVFELQGLFEKAELLLDSHKDIHQNNWRFVQLQCKVYWQKKDANGFRLAFKNLIKSKAPLQVQLKWQERLAVTELNYKLAIQALQVVLTKNLSPNPKKDQQRLSSYYRRISDSDDFLRCTNSAERKLPSFVPPFDKLTKLLLDSKSLDESLNILEGLYKKRPKNKELFFGMCQVLFKSNPKRLYEFVKKDLQDLEDLDFAKLASFPIISDLLPTLNTTTSGSSLSSKEILKAAVLDIQKGDIQKGENLLRAISRDEIPLKAEIILQALTDIPEITFFPRPLLKNACTKQEVVIAKAPQGIGTVIVFSGLGDAAAMPLNILDRYFASLNLSAIYLKDYKRLMHLDGSSELGDNFTETMHVLKKILSKLQTKRLFTFGTSAGGFGAMRYGLHLKAEATLCFSPPVFVFHPEEVRAKAFLKRLSSKFQDHEVDIRNDFAQFEDSGMKTFIYYGEANFADKRQAELLRQTRNVELNALEDFEHHASIYPVMTNQGLLPTLKKHFALEH